MYNIQIGFVRMRLKKAILQLVRDPGKIHGDHPDGDHTVDLSYELQRVGIG